MFNVGGMEILLIGIVALVVLGPDKLPGAIRQAGSFVGQMRSLSQSFSNELRSAVGDAEREADRTRGGTAVESTGSGAPAVAAAELADLLGSPPPGTSGVEVEGIPGPADERR